MTQAAVPSSDRSLRVGVVGVGVMGSNHARVFAGLPGVELVGVADPDSKQADFVAKTLGCAAVATVDELLDLKLDAVTIAGAAGSATSGAGKDGTPQTGTESASTDVSQQIGLINGANYTVHDHVAAEDDVARVWNHAEVFDYKTERLFRYLQVVTACAMSFAHGSNDVANAMGPFAAIYQTWSTGATPGNNTPVPYW